MLFNVYGFATAKLLGMKSKMLNAEDFMRLLQVSSVEEMIELLEKTHYRPYIERFMPHYHGSKLVEVAATALFSHTLRSLPNLVGEGDKELVHASLMKWHVENVKMLLSARMKAVNWHSVGDVYLDIGTFRKPEVIVEGDFSEALTEFLSSRIIRELGKRRALSMSFVKDVFERSKDQEEHLLHVLIELEQAKYSYCLDVFRARSALLFKHVKQEIDFKNAVLALKERHQPLFIKGGFISVKKWLELFERQEVREFVRKRWQLGDDDLHWAIEFRRILTQQRLSYFYISFLKPELVALFPHIHEEVIYNLKEIAVGKELGVDKDKIKEVLIL